MKFTSIIFGALALAAGTAATQANAVRCDMSYPNAYVTGVAFGSKAGFITSKYHYLNTQANGLGLARGTINVQGPANTKFSANDDLNMIASELGFAMRTGMKVKSVSSGYGDMLIDVTGTTNCYAPIPTTGTYATNITITTANTPGNTNFTSISFGK